MKMVTVCTWTHSHFFSGGGDDGYGGGGGGGFHCSPSRFIQMRIA